MCYADGGPTSNYDPNVCTDRHHFDCDHDSYFHPGTPTGYLATHWNIGWRYDWFLQFGDADHAPGSAPQNVVARDGTILKVSAVSSTQGINLTWSAPTNLGAGYVTDYVIYRTDPGQAERVIGGRGATARPTSTRPSSQMGRFRRAHTPTG